MRDYGLDELPQLVNILKRGYEYHWRPPLPSQVTQFSPQLRKMFRNCGLVYYLWLPLPVVVHLRMEERYKLHVTYVENWSLARDLLWQSLFVVLAIRN